ncbi:FAD-dependent 5-carboxymethylaminomethyl-2-thiouridine(34) oxidoreductase MnmC [Chitinimonas arctica]|uniref:tRNA 5-methylaminomethyl-2-thiouridine biosynthesis bifunctional protein MnmC n=1 Tax=Chitinimonas arctica TaxID=2594795 RepID=A0A516SAG8_9NEIS|nr:FAD-dependent 5-carboxymethylaminomethyl-2-thiouridine(34) oxidoreductase MnmC [Chitinimonas arctica]QDQ25145.1 FAD-dependent 5-carboxymethylaminomethyl-2-thiouridine(34) oxidoreductase MnmC [Chitinimonas arctica]
MPDIAVPTVPFDCPGTTPPWAAMAMARDQAIRQTRDIWLSGNDLPARWQGKAHFSICETGFGAGWRFLTTWAAWRNDPDSSKRLHFISCEAQPYSSTDLAAIHAQLLRQDTELAALAAELLAQWPLPVSGFHRLELDRGRVILTLLLGEPRVWLQKLLGRLNAFFLDSGAFEQGLLKQFTRLAANDATLASPDDGTIGLESISAAGFIGEARQGRLIGRFRGRREQATAPSERHAIVLGAGLAGSAVAERLARRGWRITLLERHASPAQGASGNHAGVYRPVISSDDNLQARLARACFLYGQRRMASLPGLLWRRCGTLQLARDEAEAARFELGARQAIFPPAYLEFVDRDRASRLAGQTVATSGIFFPQGAVIHPPSLVDAQLSAGGSAVYSHFGVEVDRLAHTDGAWQALASDGSVLGQAPVLILANAADAARFAPELGLSSESRYVSYLPQHTAPAIATVICRGAYLTPALAGLACLGSSACSSEAEETTAQTANRGLLGQMLPDSTLPTGDCAPAGRRCSRPNTIDRMPLAGPLADTRQFQPKHAGSLHLAPRRNGLYILGGFGARGLVWSGLMAELLASQIEGEPLPVERELVLAVDPARFLSRHGLGQGHEPE